MENEKFERMEKIRSEVYNALSDIYFDNDVTEEEMEQAIEWFQIHFYEK